MDKKPSTAKNVAFAGVFGAVNVILLYLASIIPGTDLTFMAIAGALVYVFCRRLSLVSGLFLFIASGLIAFLIVPAKLILLPYLVCLGPYSFGKALTHRIFEGKEERSEVVPARFPGIDVSGGIGRIFLSYLLRVLIFGALVLLATVLFKEAFFSAIELPNVATPLLILGALFMFLLYDYILGCIYHLSKRYKV